MLVLRRWPGERVRLRLGGLTVYVIACQAEGSLLHIGFDAPRSVEIEREERTKPLLERTRQEFPTIWGTF